MAFDLEEQEQLASLKVLWSRYGTPLIWLLICILAGYSAWMGWNYYLGNQAAQAAQLYEELQKAIELNDIAKVHRVAGDMENRFGNTTYAQIGAFSVAKLAFDTNDLKMVKKQLLWVIENSSSDEYKVIARIRLAGVFLDEKAYDQALNLLTADFPEQFTSLIADRKGDILMGQNKFEEARSAYQLALDRMEQRDTLRSSIQLKLEAISPPTY